MAGAIVLTSTGVYNVFLPCGALSADVMHACGCTLALKGLGWKELTPLMLCM